jgi:hypothetical protein
MKAKVLILMAAAMLFLAPSCTKQKGKWTKHTITEEYVFAEEQPQNQNNKEKKKEKEEKEKTPRLWSWKAKKLAKDLLTESEFINTPTSTLIKVGYYECNDFEERENLYKAKVNGLLNVTYSEIKNQRENPTFWVNVSLTPAGEALIMKNNAPIFPEDTIDFNYMKTVVAPETGKNQFGEFTFDSNVDSAVVALIHEFYNAYIIDKVNAINTYGTNDLIEAQNRITQAKNLGIDRMTVDPFLRNNNIDSTTINTLGLVKWTEYIDLYVVTINQQEFCVVVKDVYGTKKIDDIAINSTDNLKKKNTMRCIALNISAQALHNAQIKKDKEEEAKAKKSKKTSKIIIIEEEEEELEEETLLYEEYMPEVQPGIVEVERREPTLYEIAKRNEHFQYVELLAGDFKFKTISKLRKVKETTYDENDEEVEKVNDKLKRATITIERCNVTPLGRIHYNMVEGETKTFELIYQYDTALEEWECFFINR